MRSVWSALCGSHIYDIKGLGAQWLSGRDTAMLETEGLQVCASPALLPCVIEQLDILILA